MRGELDRIFASKRIGAWEERNQRLIQFLLAIKDIAQTSYARLRQRESQMLRGNRKSIRTTQPDESDRATAGCARNSDNRVLKLHSTRASRYPVSYTHLTLPT